MLFVAIVAVSMAAVAPLGHLRMSAGPLLVLSVVEIAGSLPFCALGFLIGTISSVKSAPAFVNLLYLPMLYLSGILFPLPKSVEWIAYLSPAYHLSQAVRAAIGAPATGLLSIHLAVLAGVTVAFTAFAVRRLARHG